jgi:hypothetical protein
VTTFKFTFAINFVIFGMFLSTWVMLSKGIPALRWRML